MKFDTIKINKKRYNIIKATCIVSRRGGIKEQDEFLFSIEYNWQFEQSAYTKQLNHQIKMFNEFCPEDFKIVKTENEYFEKVGEIWL